MKLFDTLKKMILGDPSDKSGAIPGAMGTLLAQLGIKEIGPHDPRRHMLHIGRPQQLVVIPGMERHAHDKNGKPLYHRKKNQGAKQFPTMENYAIPRKQWKQMQREQARKAAGRWYSGAEAA